MQTYQLKISNDFDRLLTVTQNSCDGDTIKPNDLWNIFTFSIPTWPSYDLMRCGVMTGAWHPDRCSRLPLRSTLRTCWWLPQLNHVKPRMYQAFTRICSIHHGFMAGSSRPELLRCVHPLVVARPMWPCWRFWTWWISSAWRHFELGILLWESMRECIVALWHCGIVEIWWNLQISPLCGARTVPLTWLVSRSSMLLQWRSGSRLVLVAMDVSWCISWVTSTLPTTTSKTLRL